MRVSIWTATMCLCALAADLSAETLEELGAFEREAAEVALARLGLLYEPEPQGRVVGHIHVVNLPVFTEEAGLLQWFNAIHVTTLDPIIRREVLVKPGQLWDEKVVAETKRVLSDPLFTTLVVVLPVRNPEQGTVDLLVVTRDVWSLRLNADYEIQGSQLTGLSIAPAENNLLGLRKTITLAFDLNQGRYAIGPRYLDKNVFGTRTTLTADAGAFFSRATNDVEGSFANVEFSLPLWALSREWGWSVHSGYTDARVRSFRGTGIRRYDNPDTPEVEDVPWQYDLFKVEGGTSVTRSFGYEIKQNVSLQYGFTLNRPEVIDGFPYGASLGTDDTMVVRRAFERDVLPRRERTSAIGAQYHFFVPNFVVIRDLATFDLAENHRLGPEILLSASASLEALGSTYNFYLLSSSLSWTLALGHDGLLRTTGSVSTRLQAGQWLDTNLSGTLFVALPTWTRWVRPVGRVRLVRRINEAGNAFFTLGGESGLRAFPLANFDGLAAAVGNVELRSSSLRVWFAKLGLVAFFDAGHAADSFRALEPRFDVGMGLRLLVPEAQPTVFRFDYAFPLNDRPTFPGRFSAGFGQVF